MKCLGGHLAQDKKFGGHSIQGDISDPCTVFEKPGKDDDDDGNAGVKLIIAKDERTTWICELMDMISGHQPYAGFPKCPKLKKALSAKGYRPQILDRKFHCLEPRSAKHVIQIKTKRPNSMEIRTALLLPNERYWLSVKCNVEFPPYMQWII